MQALPAKYYVDATGRYLGAYSGIQHDDSVEVDDQGIEVVTPGRIDYPAPPEGAIEVPDPPAHGLDTWNGTRWEPHVPAPMDWDAEIARRDPVVRALVDLIPGGMEAVKAKLPTTREVRLRE